MRKLFFFIKEGLITFRRTLVWNTFSACILAFFILLATIIFQTRSIVSEYANSVGRNAKIEAFLYDGVSDSDLGVLLENLKKNREYDSLKLVTKNEALEIFKSSFTNLDLPEKMNPLPQSIILYPNSSLIENDLVSRNIDELNLNEHIEVVIFNKTLVDKLAGIQRATDVVTLFVILILAIFGFVVYHTSVYHSLNYKYEYLEVVNHFRASSFWSSFPFFVESFMISMVSSFLFIVSYYLFNICVVDVYLVNFNYWNNLWEIVVISVFVTVFISVLSTFLSVRSYK